MRLELRRRSQAGLVQPPRLLKLLQAPSAWRRWLWRRRLPRFLDV